MIDLPDNTEYAGYYSRYITLAAVAGDNLIDLLDELKDRSYQFFTRLPQDKADHAYAEGKWTIKQVLGHMADTERIFAYRLLCLSRGEQRNLPGFDENTYTANANFNQQSLANLAQEFKIVREGTLYLLKGLTDEQTLLKGMANGQKVSVRALAWLLAGHELHHLDIVQERYL